MKIPINSQLDVHLVLDDLKNNFPDYKVNRFGTKQSINIQRGNIGVSVKLKPELVKVSERIYLNNWMGVVFVVLLVLSLVGALLFYGIVWLIKKKEIRAIQKEIGTFITDRYINPGNNNIVISQ